MADAITIKKELGTNVILAYFYNQVKSSGRWDYKNKENWERDLDIPYRYVTGKFIYNGYIITA